MDITPENKQVILATAYFPPIEYFACLVKYRNVLIDLHETYPKQTWRNRCMIISGNGPVNLSVPVEKPKGNRTKTFEVRVSNHNFWQKNHWRSIESAYSNAPYFIYYKELVQDLIINANVDMLAQMNNSILQQLCKELSVSTPISYADDFITDTALYQDMRFCISPKDRYQTGDKQLDFKPYYQVFDERWGFQPNASILDLLFNVGPDTVEYIKGISD